MHFPMSEVRGAAGARNLCLSALEWLREPWMETPGGLQLTIDARYGYMATRRCKEAHRTRKELHADCVHRLTECSRRQAMLIIRRQAKLIMDDHLDEEEEKGEAAAEDICISSDECESDWTEGDSDDEGEDDLRVVLKPCPKPRPVSRRKRTVLSVPEWAERLEADWGLLDELDSTARNALRQLAALGEDGRYEARLILGKLQQDHVHERISNRSKFAHTCAANAIRKIRLLLTPSGAKTPAKTPIGAKPKRRRAF